MSLSILPCPNTGQQSPTTTGPLRRAHLTDGIGSGHDHIRASYERVLPLIGSLDLTSVQVQDEVVYVTFRAQSDGRDDLVGTDIFVIRDGLIQIHTFYAITESPALDGS